MAWTIDPGASGGSGRKPVRDLPGQAGSTVCLAFLLSSLRILVTPHMPRLGPFPEPLLAVMQRWGPKGDSGKQKLLPDTQNCFEQGGPSGLASHSRCCLAACVLEGPRRCQWGGAVGAHGEPGFSAGWLLSGGLLPSPPPMLPAPRLTLGGGPNTLSSPKRSPPARPPREQAKLGDRTPLARRGTGGPLFSVGMVAGPLP